MRRRIEHILKQGQQQHYLKSTFPNWPDYVLEHLVSRVMKLEPELYDNWITNQTQILWRLQAVDTESIQGTTKYLAGPTAIVEELSPNEYKLLAGQQSPAELTAAWILYRLQ